jgi:hypothetical protein
MNSQPKSLITLLIVVVLALIAWAVLTMPDQRTAGQKVGDAVDALPNGVDKAARELQDRTPGERAGDAIKDAGENLKDATDRN